MYAPTLVGTFLALAATSIASPTSRPAMQKRFQGGWCTLHIHYDFDGGNAGSADVKIFDGTGFQVWEGSGDADEGDTLMMSSGGLPSTLAINLSADSAAADIATFEYNDETFGSGATGTANDHCSVGKWDYTNPWGDEHHLDMDCGFTC
ncbi:hypothetical protein F4780DRAFT_726993 [Xylariomycetidae sp. FL0641]|nr:hypothetical protein F4780DRAFT_726993 [Xylariomycetidae sp. FL0641]